MMPRSLLLIFCLVVTFTAAASAGSMVLSERKLLVRVSPNSTEAMAMLPGRFDIVGTRRGEWFDVSVYRSELDELLKLDASITILVDDLDEYVRDRAGEYHTYPQAVAIMQSIAANNPDIVGLSVIGMTSQMNFIYALEISDNVGEEEGEPEVLFTGVHHAREWPTLEICLFYADSLTSGYGIDPNITAAVDDNVIYIVPCVNPDGYIYSHDQGHDWRKNRHYFPEFQSYGVDLNRNYAGSTNGVEIGEWGSIQGSVTHDPDYETYCGPGAASEQETRTIRNLIEDHDFVIAVSYHTAGELVLWPWAYTYSSAPDAATLSAVGTEMAVHIEQQYGGGSYWPQQSSDLYPTTGDFTDWTYGGSLYSRGSLTLAYTVEACASFQPSPSYLDQIVRENFDAAMYCLEIADSLRTVMVPMVQTPNLEEMIQDGDGEYTISWIPQNPRANATRYQLDELSGYDTVTDDAESGSGLWDLNGFSLSTSRYHSAGQSFWSGSQQPNAGVSMISAYPMYVKPGQELSFWTWYNIENQADFAYLEVSRDTKGWDILDSFTGSTSLWTLNTYDLSSYEGDWLYIKFRYITDDYTQRYGFFVDDIAPVPSFADLVTLSDTIVDTFFTVTDVPRGVYYYRVRGYNDERQWGNFSQLEDIIVNPGAVFHRDPVEFP